MVVIVMGVSGSGKTTIGERLAERLGWSFYEGDEYHSKANVEKMGRGEALTDEDRGPWLQALREVIEEADREGRSAVLACSALKQKYRRRLRPESVDVRFVYLEASPALIRERLTGRKGHFFDADLLDSQFAALEAPPDALTVSAEPDPATIVARVVEGLNLSGR